MSQVIVDNYKIIKDFFKKVFEKTEKYSDCIKLLDIYEIFKKFCKRNNLYTCSYSTFRQKILYTDIGNELYIDKKEPAGNDSFFHSKSHYIHYIKIKDSFENIF